MEHQTASYDVAILGSGIAGGILGSILARNGLRVIILEEGVHPRFAVGESIVPEASFRMRLLAERYSVPELGNFSNFFRLRDHVSANSGVKRAFSFAYHHEGKAQDAAELSQFQAPGPPVGPDYHLFRQDVDAYLMTVAMRYGADVRQQAKVTKIELSSTGATLQLEKGGVVKAGYLVDGTGMRSVVADTLGLREAPTRFKTRSRCIFTHMIGVKPYDEVSPSRKEHGLPTPFHQSTLHHVFDGGWFWIIPFDNHREATNPLCSVGLTLDIDKYPGGGLPAEEEFMSFVRRFPSVAAQFEGARSARPWVSSGRLQFSSSKVIGERYAMLPHAAGFIDALFSSGLSMTIGAVGLLSDRLLQAFKDGDFSTERFARVEEYTQESLDHYDRLVANSFTSFQDFSLWNAWHRLWMMGVFIGGLSQLQSYMRYLASGDRALLKLTESPPYNGILGSRHPENREIFDNACAVMDRLRAGELTAPAAAEAVFALLEKQTVVPKYFDLHVPERRMPSRFTLMGNLKMYFWYKRHASKEYQEQFVNWNLWNMHQYTSKLVDDQMGAIGKLRRFFRDIVTTTNDDWRELPACTPCTPPALPPGAEEATASTPPAGAQRQA